MFVAWRDLKIAKGRFALIATVVTLITVLVTFLAGQKHLLGKAEPPDAALLKKPTLGPLNLEWTVYVAGLIMLWIRLGRDIKGVRARRAKAGA